MGGILIWEESRFGRSSIGGVQLRSPGREGSRLGVELTFYIGQNERGGGGFLAIERSEKVELMPLTHTK